MCGIPPPTPSPCRLQGSGCVNPVGSGNSNLNYYMRRATQGRPRPPRQPPKICRNAATIAGLPTGTRQRALRIIRNGAKHAGALRNVNSSATLPQRRTPCSCSNVAAWWIKRRFGGPGLAAPASPGAPVALDAGRVPVSHCRAWGSDGSSGASSQCESFHRFRPGRMHLGDAVYCRPFRPFHSCATIVQITWKLAHQSYT